MTLWIKIAIIAAACLAAVTLIFLMMDGTFVKKTHMSVWDKSYIDGLENDAHKIIAYALRASSSHNIQPWKVKIEDGSIIKVYADMKKALPAADRGNEQLLMSQGTFLRELENGAAQCGYKADIIINDIVLEGELPLIATVALEKNASGNEADACSSASLWVRGDETANIEKTLEDCFGREQSLDYMLIDEAGDVEQLKTLLTQGVKTESSDEAATKELLNVFRFTEREKSQWRYGLTLKMGWVISPFIQPIVKAVSGDWESFGKSSISTFEKRVDKETAYIIITCREPQTADYIQTGYVLEELGGRLSGYKILPAMQLLQDIDGMEELKNELYEGFVKEGEALIIIGVKEDGAKNRAVNPRHLPQDILAD